MSSLSRRGFIQSASAMATASILVQSQRTSAAPNERVRHAVVGTGGQGQAHVKTFSSFPDCDVVAVCDIDPERRAKAAGSLEGKKNVVQVEDYRRILDDSTIDTVSVATPDHWHTPVALAALKAGKHVYVEKPCCHTIREGELLAQAAATTGKCVQHGTQARGSQGIRNAIQSLREGRIGKVRMAKAINHQLRPPIGRTSESEPPAGVNYDLWLGPAPSRPFSQNRWHYNWHWFWDYGTGDMGNDGIHQVDVARWGLGVGLPDVVSASGGHLFYDDDHETPDTQVVTFEYKDCYLLYEMRLWTNYSLEGHDNAVVFYGDNGTIEINRGGCWMTLIGKEREKIEEGGDLPGNVRNFLDCVKAGNPGALHAPMSEGVASATLCHLGNIATRVSRRLELQAAPLSCVNDQAATDLFTKVYRSGYELPSIP